MNQECEPYWFIGSIAGKPTMDELSRADSVTDPIYDSYLNYVMLENLQASMLVAWVKLLNGERDNYFSIN